MILEDAGGIDTIQIQMLTSSNLTTYYKTTTQDWIYEDWTNYTK
jgi:hypothetical protein